MNVATTLKHLSCLDFQIIPWNSKSSVRILKLIEGSMKFRTSFCSSRVSNELLWRLTFLNYEFMARMCKRGPKLTVVCHIPNHPTTFGRNFECKMIFASFRPFRVRLSVVRVLGLVLGIALSLVQFFMFNT